MWRPSTKIVAAVSGGSDSVGMLLLLHALHLRGELTLAAVAHLNHGIRPDAPDDERYCGELAGRLGLPFHSRRVDVPALARRSGRSVELTARQVRREFLDEVRRALDADVVATAHTRDDQAETVLLRLVRGAGVRGLGAIAPRGGRRIRPVLCMSRNELQEELRARGESWREDVTNLELTHPRNRVRHELLPYLARHFNPSVTLALARLADHARADHDYLAREATATAVSAMQVDAKGVRLRRDALLVMAEPIARRVVQYALAAVRGGASASAREVDAVLSVARRDRAGAELAGLLVERSGPFVVLLTGREAIPGLPAFEHELPVPGRLARPDAGWVIEALGPMPAAEAARSCAATVHPLPAEPEGGLAEPARHAPAEAGPGSCVQVAADGLPLPLVVRSWRPGDRLQPLGLAGRKKVQDILVDRKVPRRERDRVPIVTDRGGRIVWVAGHALGEAFRVTEHTKAVIILKLGRV